LLSETLAQPAPQMLVEDLVPADGITLIHAQPRVLKTWTALDIAVGVASGTAVFHWLATGEGAPVAYITEEDPRRRIAERLDALWRGRNLAQPPSRLYVAAQTGLSLDDPEWQERVIAFTRRAAIRLLIIDPARSVTACVDQGPRELRPFVRFLRELQAETGTGVLICHHDTKPVVGRPDDRSRPQRASGGGLFSACESPIHAELVSECPATTLLVPTAWKHTEAPAPLKVTLTVGEGGARLVAEPTHLASAVALGLQGRILDALREHGELSGSAIARIARGDKSRVLKALDLMARLGAIANRPGRRGATLWVVREDQS
jgi:hypothetical protein